MLHGAPSRHAGYSLTADKDVERAGHNRRPTAGDVPHPCRRPPTDEHCGAASGDRCRRMRPGRRWQGTGVSVTLDGGRLPPDEHRGHTGAGDGPRMAGWISNSRCGWHSFLPLLRCLPQLIDTWAAWTEQYPPPSIRALALPLMSTFVPSIRMLGAFNSMRCFA